MKRLIADSGATKTDWCLIKGNEILKHYSGKGISPVFQTEDQISNEIHNNVFPEFKEWNISKIHFYGSGCIDTKPDIGNKVIIGHDIKQ